MAFGLLTTKWRTFRRNLDVKVSECASLIAGQPQSSTTAPENDGSAATFDKSIFCGADFGVENLPNHNKGCPNTLPTGATRGTVEKDQRRASILAEIETMQLQRPIDNIL